MQETKNILVIVFVSNLTNCAHKERSNERGFILMRNTDRTCIALGRVRIRNRRENGIFKGLMACYLGLLKREGKNGQVLWILGISEAEKRHSHALWGRSFPWRFERFEHFTQSRVCFLLYSSSDTTILQNVRSFINGCVSCRCSGLIV